MTINRLLLLFTAVVVTACQAVIPDDETLQRLTLSMDPTIQLQPGENHEFAVGVVECCYFFEEVDVKATWSISPTAGASINPRTGLLRIDKDTPPGSVYTVTAAVHNGRAAPEIDVHIYTLADSPLIGKWKERKQYACNNGEETTPAEPIRELVFDADGTFSVTWFPFEVYRDYWGTYSYENTTGDLRLIIDHGNYIPEDFDGTGNARLDEDQDLILDEVWLGSPSNGKGGSNCGHLFAN